MKSNDSSALKWQIGDIYSTRTWDASQLFYSVFPTLNNFVDFAKQLDNAEAAFGQVWGLHHSAGFRRHGGIRWTSEMKDMDRVNSHLATNTGPSNIVSIYDNPDEIRVTIYTKDILERLVSRQIGLSSRSRQDGVCQLFHGLCSRWLERPRRHRFPHRHSVPIRDPRKPGKSASSRTGSTIVCAPTSWAS